MAVETWEHNDENSFIQFVPVPDRTVAEMQASLPLTVIFFSQLSIAQS